MVCVQIKKYTVSLLYDMVGKVTWDWIDNIFKKSLWYKLIV